MTLVAEYHQRSFMELPNLRAKTISYMSVESEALLDNEILLPVTRARLNDEALYLHNGVISIAFVLSRVMFDVVRGGRRCDMTASCARKRAELTAPTWRAQANEGAAP